MHNLKQSNKRERQESIIQEIGMARQRTPHYKQTYMKMLQSGSYIKHNSILRISQGECHKNLVISSH